MNEFPHDDISMIISLSHTNFFSRKLSTLRYIEWIWGLWCRTVEIRIASIHPLRSHLPHEWYNINVKGHVQYIIPLNAGWVEPEVQARLQASWWEERQATYPSFTLGFLPQTIDGEKNTLSASLFRTPRPASKPVRTRTIRICEEWSEGRKIDHCGTEE